MHQAAAVFGKFALQHGCQGALVIFQRNVGNKPQAALVDANQRHTKARQLPANAQHRAVATHYQPHVALRTDAVHIQYRVVVNAGVAGSVFL